MKRIKKVFPVLSVCLLLIITLFTNVVFAQNGSSVFTVSDAKGKVGDQVAVSVGINNISEDLTGITVKISFDETKVKLVNIEDTAMLAEYVNPNLDQSGESFLLSWGNGLSKIPAETAGTSETIVKLTFEILDGFTEGTTAIHVTTHEAYDFDLNSINIAEASGIITLDNPVHEHTYGEWETEKEATCEENGLKIQSCTVCGYENKEEIEKLGHEGQWTETKAATCTEEGEKTQSCIRCGKKLSVERINKTEHTAGDWQVEKEASCIEAGSKIKKCQNCGATVETEVIETIDHQYGEWEVKQQPTILEEGLEERVCQVCQNLEQRIIPRIAHEDQDHQFDGRKEIVKEATCTEEGEERVYCSVEGCEEYMTFAVPAKGHTNGEWEIEKEATCTEEGRQIKKCTVCGVVTQTEIIPMENHVVGEWTVTKEATCTEKGEQNKYCTECGLKVETSEIEMLGHEYSNWEIKKEATCIEEGEKKAVCIRCNAETTEIIPIVDHVLGEWTVTKEATCIEEGEKEQICEVCDNVIVTEVVPALGHEYGNQIIEKEATCTEEGIAAKTCSRCAEKSLITIPAIGHAYGEIVIIKEATVDEDGEGQRVCENCGDVLTMSIPKLSEGHSHDFSGEKTTVKEATCIENGIVKIKCSNQDCDAVQIVEIAAIPHNYSEWRIVKEATSDKNGAKERECTVCGIKETENIPATGERVQVEKNQSINTGDAADIDWWYAMMFVAVGIIGYVFLKKRIKE